MKLINQFKVWSNIFFLLPLFFAIQNRIFWYSTVIGVMILVSLFYHLSNEKKYFYRDCLVSTILMTSNFILLIFGKWLLPFSMITIFFAIIAIYFYTIQFKKNYNLNHGLWHFFSAIVCCFSILTFIS